MRVLFVSNLFPPHHIGGYELVCQRTAEALRQRGHEIHVLTSSFGGHTEMDDEPYVRRLLSCAYRLPDFFPDASPQQAEENGRILLQEIRRLQPEVVMLWDTHGIGLLQLYSTALQAGAQVATRIGDYQFWPNWDRLRSMPDACLATLKDPRLRVAVNARTLGADHIRAGVPAEQLAVLHSWVQLRSGDLPPSPAPPPTFRVVWAGRLSHRKGLRVAVEGIRLLVGKHDVPASLDIIGEGDTSELDQEMARAAEPEANGSAPFPVRYLGPMQRDRLLAHLSGYHVMVVPSLEFEAFGTICIEAMAAGVPVVASRIGGLIETTANGRFGLLFEPGDSVGLARQLLKLARNHRLRERLRVEGHRHVRCLYEREISMDRFEAFLQGCAAGLPVSAMSASVPRMTDPPQFEHGVLRFLAQKVASILAVHNAGLSDWYEHFPRLFH